MLSVSLNERRGGEGRGGGQLLRAAGDGGDDDGGGAWSGGGGGVEITCAVLRPFKFNFGASPHLRKGLPFGRLSERPCLGTGTTDERSKGSSFLPTPPPHAC